MRRMWAAGAAVAMCLAIGGLPVAAQSPSVSPATPPPDAATHVLGPISLEGASLTPDGVVYQLWGEVATGDARFDGCVVIDPDGRHAWGTLVVIERCYGWRPLARGGATIWDGEWFSSGAWPLVATGESLPASAAVAIDTVWLHGQGPNVGWSAVLRIEHGVIDGWIFPTPPGLPLAEAASPSPSAK